MDGTIKKIWSWNDNSIITRAGKTHTYQDLLENYVFEDSKVCGKPVFQYAEDDKATYTDRTSGMGEYYKATYSNRQRNPEIILDKHLRRYGWDKDVVVKYGALYNTILGAISEALNMT